MSKNNNVTLIGNLGTDPTFVENDDKLFAAFSLATADSFLDEGSNTWQTRSPVWHNVLVFKPDLVERLHEFNKGARVEVRGSLSYRPFEVARENKPPVKKMEASIIAHVIQPRPLS